MTTPCTILNLLVGLAALSGMETQPKVIEAVRVQEQVCVIWQKSEAEKISKTGKATQKPIKTK